VLYAGGSGIQVIYEHGMNDYCWVEYACYDGKVIMGGRKCG
jgi:hypothetical protein